MQSCILKSYRLLVRYCSSLVGEMKYLNVAEKNDAAKTIAGLLSNGSSRRREGLSVYNKIYEFEAPVFGKNAKMVMTSVSGHLFSYEFMPAYRGWHNCDPDQLFDAPVRKACSTDNEKIRKTIEREIKSCQGLIIWTDCDREGENIGFEIIEVCKAVKSNITVHRAKFSDITSRSVRRALSNLVSPDEKQNEAVNIRQELDLRTGAAFTRLQTLRLQRMFPSEIAENLISYGSCQIPTLGFVAQRYKEAEEFVPEPFWKLKVLHTIDELTVEFNWARNRLFDKEACEDYLMLCLADPIAKVENVTVKPKNKWRPQPMDTVSLEKLGSRKLKLNAKTTMQIAEKLYTQGIISYPRTETNSFSKDVNLRSLVELHTPDPNWGPFAMRVMEWGPNPRNGQKSDEAHPPIHPTKYTSSLSGNEQRLYELIVRHFLACVSKDATGSETIVNISIAGEKFSANGLVIFERNYLDVYPYEKWNAKEIHRYEIGQTFEPTEISMQEGMTTAPPLLTEADLIALMEKNGIGTDATHAEHIHTIKERGYIGEVDRGLLVPGTIGMGLFEGYDAMELPLAYPKLRADFEVDLKKICNGEKNPQTVLREQIQHYKQAYRLITEKFKSMCEKMAKRLNVSYQEPPPSDQFSSMQSRVEEVLKCPKCSNCSMALKTKKDNAGFYIGCLGYPQCKNVVWLPDEFKEIKVTNEDCPRCGPGYKQISVKFKQNNYLALLHATESTYKTCLVCDARFRHTFNINVDSVKKVGGIVSDQSHQNNLSVLRNSNAREAPRSTNSNNTQRNSQYRGWFSADEDDRSTSNNFRRNRAESTSTSDVLFADDDFDDVLGTSDFSSLENSTRQQQNLNNRPAGGWGSGSTTRNGNINYSNRNSSGNSISANSNERSWRNPQSNNEGWGSGSNSNRNSRPNNKTVKQNSRAGTTTNNWGTSSNIYDVENQNNGDVVKCTSCNENAKLLTVKKDGPNKGRPFYLCPRPQDSRCNFFQWGDENVPANVNTSSNTNHHNTNAGTSWGTRQTSQPSTSTGSSTSDNERQRQTKKRKCGYCRQEGHTKLKCPRREEFES